MRRKQPLWNSTMNRTTAARDVAAYGRIWFKHVKSHHYVRCVRDHFDQQFENNRIGCVIPVACRRNDQIYISLIFLSVLT